MKKRSPHPEKEHGPEFRGVVKKMTGRLTNDPALEKEGDHEMLGHETEPRRKGARREPPQWNPDPYRRS